MWAQAFQGVMIPFLGTALGSASVLFMKNKLNPLLQRALTGFAAGFTVMMVLDVALGLIRDISDRERL